MERQKIDLNLSSLGTKNGNRVSIVTNKGNLDLIFSYKTLISFRFDSEDKVFEETKNNSFEGVESELISQCCPNKSERLDEKEFKKSLYEAFRLLL